MPISTSIEDGKPMELEAQRALAAEMFPREWALALARSGRRRSTSTAMLRKRAIAETIMRPIRAAGGACANCDNRLRNPGMMKGLFCDLGSDFYGYLTTKPDGLCPDYQGRAMTAAPTPTTPDTTNEEGAGE